MDNMDGLEDKLGAILGNPQMMQQIMSMAQSLSSQQESPHPETEQSLGQSNPDFDPALIQKIMGIAGQMGTDPHQKALLAALRPYLATARIMKLEKAMRAAKLANLASAAFSSGGLSFLTGR